MTNLTSHRAIASLAAAVAAAVVPFSTILITPAFAASVDRHGVVSQAPYGASSNEVGPTQPTTVQLPRSVAQAPYGASSNEVGPTQPTTVQLPRSVSLPRASVIPGHVDIWVPPARVL